MFKLAEYAKQISELERCSVEAMKTAGYNYTDTKQDAPISIVVAGQYSAGKSTIIKMLTGRNDIEIGAKITTQKADIYEWNGLRIVDTPGIHTELRPDHDEISYSEIASADMLIYVITNELFDNYLAEANTGKGLRFSRKLLPFFKFVVPLLILAILIQGLETELLGLLNAIKGLFVR